MGYRPTVVARKEYGQVIQGFSYEMDRFEEVLAELGLSWQACYGHRHEIECRSVEEAASKIDVNHPHRDVIDTLVYAMNTPYARDTGYILIEWF